MGSFNTFGRSETSYGSGKNIWYRIKDKYPGGGSVDLTGVTEGTVIPAGSMCVFDHAAKTIKVVKAADIGTGADKTAATAVNGLLENDIYVEKGTDYATGAVVFDGSVYADRLAEEVPAEVWANLPQIVPIREK